LYEATNDVKYLERSKPVFARFKQVFSKDDVIIDECEPTASCKVNQASFKGIAIRGLTKYFEVADAETKASIQNMIKKSAQGMAATCNDAWACNTLWTPGSPVYSDVHTQNTALELLNALSIVSDKLPGNGPVQPQSSVTVQPPSVQSQSSVAVKPQSSVTVKPQSSVNVKPVTTARRTSAVKPTPETIYIGAAAPYSMGMLSTFIGYLLAI
jgi:hypothetical protein